MTEATLIGDLVGSRAAGDRRAVHARLRRVLVEVSGEFGLEVPLRITVGDEYQGIFPTLGDALAATLRLRLGLLGDASVEEAAIDVRHGVGLGGVTVLQESPRVEDGPGWWAARAAIERVEEAQGRAPLRAVSTAYAAAADAGGPDPDLVNAALMLRDQVFAGLSSRSVSVLHGLIGGQTQKQVAERLGVSASAVSQRVRTDGIGALLAADGLLAGIE